MNKALFIFRRDLRLEDNRGLSFALREAKEVVCSFIFTEEQIEKNPYRSDHALQFMLESLEELREEIEKKGGKLFFFRGKTEDIVETCIQKVKIDGVVVNRDYTPYSRQRDEKIESICKKKKIPFFSCNDALLHPPEETLKPNGKPYVVFTPFFKTASLQEVLKPEKNSHTNYSKEKIPFALKEIPRLKQAADLDSKGGRKAALKLLSDLKSKSHYAKERDFPCKEGTCHLSAHLKFTTCSIREVFWKMKESLGSDTELIRSLYWRDFFSQIAYFFPHVFKGAFHSKFDSIAWRDSANDFTLWKEGNTGFPIVDAGMREMRATGFMHNRVRMITASFLIKDLHIDWRKGEKYFAQTLVDYDPAVNNGNWQWVASTGCDAQPYFRIFNPWTQQKKFDPDCIYIRKWILELKDLSNREIHSPKRQNTPNYPDPMLDHAKEAKKAKTLLSNL